MSKTEEKNLINLLICTFLSSDNSGKSVSISRLPTPRNAKILMFKVQIFVRNLTYLKFAL